MYPLVQNISLFLLGVGFTPFGLWILAGLIVASVISLLLFFQLLASLTCQLLAKKYPHSHRLELWRLIIDKFRPSWIGFNGVYYAILVLPLAGEIKIFFTVGYLVLMTLFLIDLLRTIILGAIRIYLEKRGKVSQEAIETVINFFRVVSTILLWLLTGVIVLVILNVDIKGLLSGLGIASIVVAFGFQQVLKDILAFFTLYIDRSFAVGDYVTFGDYEGTIKEIRIRTTRIKALLGNELIVPNEVLIGGVIQNYNRFGQRRVSFTFKTRVVPADRLQAALEEIRQTFANGDLGERVSLTSLTLESITDYGLQIKIIFRFSYIHGQKNYTQYLHKRQEVNTLILNTLAKYQIPLVELSCAHTQA
ncbi:mechanosensitive ion channel [bacterium]|nr:mechanosensitive ion channel [bacterium]